MSLLTNTSSTQNFILFILLAIFLIVNLSFFRLATILSRAPPRQTRPPPSTEHPTHLLVVLGSGGHTAEMLNILSSIPNFQQQFTYRTYVVSSGDSFSAQRAHDFELQSSSSVTPKTNSDATTTTTATTPPSTLDSAPSYTILTVHRARKIHQPLLTTPISSLKCLWDSIRILHGDHDSDMLAGDQHGSASHEARPHLYPDVILTNGPGTGVIMILASVILLFFGFHGGHRHYHSSSSPPSSSAPQTYARGQMRSIYIESWARVRTLSLSGRLLKPCVDRFLVQWPQLADGHRQDRDQVQKQDQDQDQDQDQNQDWNQRQEQRVRGRRDRGKVEYIGPLIS